MRHTTRLGPIRFFRVMPLHSPFLLFGLCAAALVGGLTLYRNPQAGVSALMPLLMLQMFAASSGFDVPARRGHFDLLLIGGSSRGRIAVGHFVMSALPGVVVWCAVGLLEVVVNHGSRAVTFSSGSLAALFVVSAVAWAVTVPLPRLSGGVIWLLLVAMTFAPATEIRGTLMAALNAEGSLMVRTVASILFPFVMLGTRLDAAAVPTIFAVLFSGVVWGGALWWVIREDVPLETAQ